MRDGSSFHTRSQVVATEARRMVREAAQPIRPGETVKAQMNRAAAALGFPRGHWRIRAAWYGEAGSWSAAALDELRARWRRWVAAQERKANEEARLHHARLCRLREALSQVDPDFYREEIDALERVVVPDGHRDRAMDSAD